MNPSTCSTAALMILIFVSCPAFATEPVKTQVKTEISDCAVPKYRNRGPKVPQTFDQHVSSWRGYAEQRLSILRRSEKFESTSVIAVHLNSEGTILDSEVMKSSGSKDADTAALNLVRKNHSSKLPPSKDGFHISVAFIKFPDVQVLLTKAP